MRCAHHPKADGTLVGLLVAHRTESLLSYTRELYASEPVAMCVVVAVVWCRQVIKETYLCIVSGALVCFLVVVVVDVIWWRQVIRETYHGLLELMFPSLLIGIRTEILSTPHDSASKA
jgi:cadmium resistance protein CadD (predicted permease)